MLRTQRPMTATGLAAGMLLLLAVVAAALNPLSVEANVTVTPGSGGTSISADDAGGAWTDLGAVTIAEGAASDISGGTLILTAPSGFEYNTGRATNVSATVGDITAVSLSFPSSSTMQITITAATSLTADTITIGGTTSIQVRPTGGTPLASGNILRTSGNPGTATIAGITNDTTNFGSLSMAAGSVAQLGVATQPSGATAGAAFGTQPVVRTEDQYGNPSTSGLAASLNVTAALTTGTGPLQGTSAIDIGTGAGNGTVSFTNLQLDVAQNGAVLTFSASGLTSVASAAFNVSASAATQLAVTTQPSASTASGTAFAQQPIVTIRDAFGNTVTGDSSTVVTATLTGGSGTLSGTATETAASGIADFSGNGLSIDLVGADKVLTFSAGGLTSASTSAFAITAGSAAAATSTIVANPTSISANGASQSTITVQLKDASGNNLTAGGDTVALSSTLGSLGSVADGGDGTYTATLTAGTTAGTATVTGTVNAAAITDDASVTLVAVAVPSGGGSASPTPTPEVEDDGLTIEVDTSDEADAVPGSDTELSLSSSDGRTVTVTAPADSLPSGAKLTASIAADLAAIEAQAPPADGTSIVAGLVISATDSSGASLTENFDPAITIEIGVPASNVPTGTLESELAVAFWNGDRWELVYGTVTANADGSFSLTIEVDHLTVFSVIYQQGGVRSSSELDGPPLPASGFGLVTFGGSVDELRFALAAACPSGAPIFATVGGEFVGFFPSTALASPNAQFLGLYSQGLPDGTPLLGGNCG